MTAAAAAGDPRSQVGLALPPHLVQRLLPGLECRWIGRAPLAAFLQQLFTRVWLTDDRTAEDARSGTSRCPLPMELFQLLLHLQLLGGQPLPSQTQLRWSHGLVLF